MKNKTKSNKEPPNGTSFQDKLFKKIKKKGSLGSLGVAQNAQEQAHLAGSAHDQQ